MNYDSKINIDWNSRQVEEHIELGSESQSLKVIVLVKL